MLYIQRTRKIYDNEDYDRPTTGQRETVVAIPTAAEARIALKILRQVDPSWEYYSSTKPSKLVVPTIPVPPPVKSRELLPVEPGKTYHGKWRTSRTVISVENGMVTFTQPGREGEHKLSVRSFIDWAGLRRHGGVWER